MLNLNLKYLTKYLVKYIAKYLTKYLAKYITKYILHTRISWRNVGERTERWQVLPRYGISNVQFWQE